MSNLKVAVTWRSRGLSFRAAEGGRGNLPLSEAGDPLAALALTRERRAATLGHTPGLSPSGDGGWQGNAARESDAC